jgi:hypothetical protein
MGLRTPRSQQLEQLAGAVPGQQQQQVGQQQAGQQMQLQAAFGAGQRQPGQAPTAGQIQQIGAEATKAAGATAVQGAQQTQQRLGGIADEQLKLRQQEKQNQLQYREDRLSEKSRELQGRLYGINRKLGRELYGEQMKFEKDELGRKLFNERQLTDWAILKAQNEEELKNYEQLVTQMSDRKMKMYEAAQARIQQEMKLQFELDETRRDGQLMIKLANAERAMKLKMQREKARAANRAAMFGAIGGIVGGVAGGIIGGPAGAMAGASLGQGLGTFAASQTD